MKTAPAETAGATQEPAACLPILPQGARHPASTTFELVIRGLKRRGGVFKGVTGMLKTSGSSILLCFLFFQKEVGSLAPGTPPSCVPVSGVRAPSSEGKARLSLAVGFCA